MKLSGRWIIKDWTGTELTYHGTFQSFEEAEEALSIFLNNAYEDDRQEYFIVGHDTYEGDDI